MKNESGVVLLRAGRILMALFLAAVLGACDLMPSRSPAPPPTTDPGQSPDGSRHYLPYSIRFDKKGAPVVVDQNGNSIPVVEVQPPLKATALESIQSMSSVIYKGSCKQVFYIGGKLYEVNLPPEYCQE